MVESITSPEASFSQDLGFKVMTMGRSCIHGKSSQRDLCQNESGMADKV